MPKNRLMECFGAVRRFSATAGVFFRACPLGNLHCEVEVGKPADKESKKGGDEIKGDALHAAIIKQRPSTALFGVRTLIVSHSICLVRFR